MGQRHIEGPWQGRARVALCPQRVDLWATGNRQSPRSETDIRTAGKEHKVENLISGLWSQIVPCMPWDPEQSEVFVQGMARADWAGSGTSCEHQNTGQRSQDAYLKHGLNQARTLGSILPIYLLEVTYLFDDPVSLT